MSNEDVVIGRMVVWRTLNALIINAKYSPSGVVLVQIRLAGNHTHWTDARSLTRRAVQR